MAEAAEQNVPQAQDPLDIATELLFRTLTNLESTISDFKRMEQHRLILDAAKTTALIDIAKSLRVANQLKMTEAEEREKYGR